MKEHRFTVLALLVMTACSEKASEGSRKMTGEAPSSSTQYPSDIVGSDAQLTKVTAGYSFDTAGSPLHMDGVLYFTNNNFDRPVENRTLRQTKNGAIDTLVMNNGVTTTLQASGKGTIYASQMLGHQVVELDTAGQILNVVVGEYNGTRIDGPNGLVVDRKRGTLF